MAKFIFEGKEVESPYTPDATSFKQWNGLPADADVKLVTEAPVTIEGEAEAPEGDITKAAKPKAKK